MKCPLCRHKIIQPAYKSDRLWRCEYCRANGCVDHGPQRLVLCHRCYKTQLCPECGDTIETPGGRKFVCRPCKEEAAEEALTVHRRVKLIRDQLPVTMLEPMAVPIEGIYRITIEQKGRAVATNSAQSFDVDPGDVLEWNGRTWRKL